MSTTIDVFPTNAHLPLVEQTRARTQELFQQLLDRHDVGSIVEVRAFYPDVEDSPVRYAAVGLRWEPGLCLGFSYWIDGEWVSSSWPGCLALEDEHRIREKDLRSEERPYGEPPESLGQWWFSEDLQHVLTAEALEKVQRSQHYWSEYRNMGGHPVASTGYGLVAAALAEATEGFVASWDCAFEDEHNGETAEQFLAWWGDDQIGFYGVEKFRSAR